MIVPFLRLRDWVNAAGLLLMLLAAACATPAPQVAAPPPGQARIWFYRLWDPSESLNVANIGMNGVYVGSVEPGGAFYRDVAPDVYQIMHGKSVAGCTSLAALIRDGGEWQANSRAGAPRA